MDICIFLYSENRYLIKANFINTINVIKGFAKNNLNVYIGHNNFDIEKVKDIYNLYNFKNINYIYTNEWVDLDKFINEKKIKIVYARHFDFPIYLLNKGYPFKILLESHGETPPARLLPYKNKINFITISHILENRWKFPKSLVFPCAIDYDFFSTKQKHINFKFDFNITYSGHIYPYKGIPILIELARKIPEIGVHIIGGYSQDIKQYKNIPTNLQFYGYKLQKDLLSYLHSSQLLILPYTNKHMQSISTSPIKLFEYLSTGKPVLSSDIIGIKTWGKDLLTYYKADNIDDLKKKVLDIKNNYNNYNKHELIKNRKEYAKKFSCENKCKLMLEI